MPTRDDAWDLVCEYTTNPGLRRHMLAVEAAMQVYAKQWDEDEALWGIVGLLHDFDYERFPDEHPEAGQPILAEHGWDEVVCRTILSHAKRDATPRRTRMEHALHACDDVTGLVVACALVRPDRDIRGVKPSSLRKKWRNHAFAGGVDRDVVVAACRNLGVDLDEHLDTVLSALQDKAKTLDLAGAG